MPDSKAPQRKARVTRKLVAVRPRATSPQRKMTASAPPNRKYEGGPTAGKKATARTVATARKTLKTATVAKARQSAPTYRGRNAPAGPGNRRPAAPPKASGPLETLTSFVQDRLDTVAGKKKTLVPKASSGRPAAIPYVQRKARQIGR